MYLVGSFSVAKDAIERRLGAMYDLNNPTNHDQHVNWALNAEDLCASAESDAILAVFSGKWGQMSFVELGYGHAKGTPIVTINDGEEGAIRDLLGRISGEMFPSTDEAIKYMLAREAPFERGAAAPQRFDWRDSSQPKPLRRVYVSGDATPRLRKVLDAANEARAGAGMGELEYVFATPDVYADYGCLRETDLVVVNFKRGWQRKRSSQFMMGAAGAMGIPVVMRDAAHPHYLYPPLPSSDRRTLSLSGGSAATFRRWRTKGLSESPASSTRGRRN